MLQTWFAHTQILVSLNRANVLPFIIYYLFIYLPLIYF